MTNEEQLNLVREYCGIATARMSRAATREEAISIKEEACAQFGQSCTSELVAHATKKFLEEQIREAWGENGTR
jgi:hypothetical protein